MSEKIDQNNQNDSSMDSIAIGKAIASLRKTKGVSTDEVSKKIKISEIYLKNIEQGIFTFIDRVYVIGFIENYCLELGKEGKEFFHQNKKSILTCVGKEEEITFNKAQLNLKNDIKVVSGEKRYILIVILILILILIIGGIFFFIFFKNTENNFNLSEIQKTIEAENEKFIFNKKSDSFKLFESDEILLEKKNITLRLTKIEEDKATFKIESLFVDDFSNKNSLNEGFYNQTETNTFSNLILYSDTIENLVISSNVNFKLKIEKNNQNYIIIYIENLSSYQNDINYTDIWKTNTRLQHKKPTIILSKEKKTNISVYIKSTFLPSYILYNIDGYRTSKSYLKKNEFLTIKANELLQLDIGNYKTVMFIVNEIPIDLLEVGKKKSFATSKIIRWVPNQNNTNYFDLIIESAVKNMQDE